MSEPINTGNSRQNSKHSQRSRKRLTPHVDMTPMVDLGFLLITFFMLSTTLSEQKGIIWHKPIAEAPPDAVSECQVMNIVVDSFDRVFVYEGSELQNLKLSSFAEEPGILQLIISKNKRVKSECPPTITGKKREVICLIKLLNGARYKNMIDIMDDMKILSIESYALQEPSNEEIAAVALQSKKLFARK